MDLHRPYIAKAVLAPDLLVKLIGRKEGVRVADKEGQDAVFHISQMDAAAVLLYAVAVGVQCEGRAVVAVDAGFCAVHLDPADVGHDAGQKDLVVIGLGQKVIAAHFQRTDDGVGVVQTGGEDDGAVVPASQALAEVYSIGVREKDIHQDDIEPLPRMAQRVAARLRTDHLEILLAL